MPAKKAAAPAPKKAAATPAHASYKGTSQRFLVHNAVGMFCTKQFLDRVSLLIPRDRYDQGSDTQCESILFAPRRFDWGTLKDDCPQYHQHAIVQCGVDPRQIVGHVTDVSSVKAQRQNWQQVRDFTIIPCFEVLWALPVAFVSGAPS